MVNKVVATGATGVIGVALIKKLLSEGVKTLVLCNPKSKRVSRFPKSNLLTVEYCSLDELNTLSLNEADFDTFFHLGWLGTDKGSRDNPLIQNLNIEFTMSAIKLAKRLGCKTFIGAGSQAEYGRTNSVISEESVCKPETAYGCAKYETGKNILIKAQELSIRAIWARFFSVYGPYDGDNTLISYLIREFSSHRSPKLTACTQIWNYLYSDDAADALFKLANSEEANGIYCIASEDTRMLKEFVLELKNVMASNTTIDFGAIQYPEGQVMSLKPDISKLKQDTNFSPKTSFRDGVSQVIKYMDEGHF